MRGTKNVNKARPLFLLCAITYFLFLFFIFLGLWDSCPCALFVSSFDFFHALSLAVMPFFPFCFLFCFSSQESLWYFIVLWNQINIYRAIKSQLFNVVNFYGNLNEYKPLDFVVELVSLCFLKRAEEMI